MTSELRCVVMDSADPVSLGRFWSALLDRSITGDREGEVRLPLCERVDLVLVTERDPKQGKNRLHFDLASTSADNQVELVERAQMLGAATVDIGQGAAPWVVLTDPEGNEFCVLEPREEYMTNRPVAALVIDALNPTGLAAFWSHATGLPMTRAHPEYATVRRESGFWLEFVRVTEPKQVRNRLRLDVVADAGGDVPNEAERLEARGAVASYRDGLSVALVDPGGNEFRVRTAS
jgi:Glyoxalase-like domain